MIQRYKYKLNYLFSADFTSSLFLCLHLLINSDFYLSLSLKCFKSQNFSVKQSLKTPLLGVPWIIIIIFHFILAVIFWSFKFHMYLESSVLLTYFLRRKSYVLFLKRSLNKVFSIPKYFLSGLLYADTTALYTIFAVKPLLSSGHSPLFLQLHPRLLEVNCIICVNSSLSGKKSLIFLHFLCT